MEDYRVTQTGDEIQEIFNQSPVDTSDISELKEAATDLQSKIGDKEYAPADYSGLGRKNLPKNMVNGVNTLTQAMLNDEHTVYHIQYDYDLGGETIEIPEGCVLEFDGGSVSNGTVNGDHYSIKASGKIFSDILLTGGFALNEKVYVDWFCDKFITKLSDIDSADDCYDQIMECITSGAKKIVFSSSHYYNIESTLLVDDDDVYLLGEETVPLKVSSSRFDVSDGKIGGGIYSKVVSTLLRYKFKSTRTVTSLEIAGLNFLCRKPFTVETLTTTRAENVVEVLCNNSNGLNGFTFNCNIIVADCNLGEPYYTYMPSYTGLYIKANTGHITFVTIDGSIKGCYRAVLTEHSGGSAWFTELTLKADTWCGIGGEFSCTPVKIEGKHQATMYDLDSVVDQDTRGYFNGSWFYMNTNVWDVGGSQEIKEGSTVLATLKNAQSAVNFTDQRVAFNHGPYNDAFKYTPIRYFYQNIGFSPDYYDYGNICPANLLDYQLNKISTLRTLITNMDYKVDNVSILTGEPEGIELFNAHHLFGDPGYLRHEGGSSGINDATGAVIRVTDETRTISCSVTFTIQGGVNTDCAGRITINDGKNFTITCKDSSNNTLYTGSIARIGERGAHLFELIRYATYTISFTIDCTKNVGYALPHIYVPAKKSDVDRINLKQSYVKLSSHRFGVPFFDGSLRSPAWWNGTKFVGADGFVFGRKAGSSSLRGNIETESGDTGYLYFNTTTNKPNWWNGTKWLEADGANAGVKRSGKYSQKPSADDIYVGFKYFCTDKQTAEGETNGIEIIYKGQDTTDPENPVDVWVDALGRTIS